MRAQKRHGLAVAAGVLAAGAVVFFGVSQGAIADGNASGGAARAILRDASGARVGRVAFVQNGDVVTVRATAEGLLPEFHGFHVHQVGRCDAPDFVSAGSHFSLAGEAHGAHAGDLPSLLVNMSGSARMTFATERFRVSDLLADDGAAVIVHANRDNFANIPTRYAAAPDATTLGTGDAGARIACGVIESSSGNLELDF
jgi:Cu-Zn family superoxide dismutase